MASDWYYTINGQQAPGPVTTAQLKQMAVNGQLQPTDLVWQEGMPSWAAASTVKGLFTASRSGEQAALLEPSVQARPRSRKRGRGGAEVAVEPPGGLLGLHPLLVVLLGVCTGGLFGLVYAYLACSAYADHPGQRPSDSAGRPLGKLRHPLGVALLTYLTFGLYGYYWLYQVMSECAAYTGRKDLQPTVEVSLALLFPPYAIFIVVFRLPQLIAAAGQQAKLPELSAGAAAPIFLLPCLAPALPLLNMAQQDALNQVWLEAS